MSRTADYTIQGFLYQFNKTLLEILKAQDDAVITIEGIIEDIEIGDKDLITAIQCKYHESNETYTVSAIYKPLLQMMHHFHFSSEGKINYVLFAHFPGLSDKEFAVDKAELQKALSSTNKVYKSYVDELNGKIDLDAFLKKFSTSVGPAFDELVNEAYGLLEVNGISTDDVKTLAYPNAIQLIANLSILHDAEKRKITKRDFLSTLHQIKTTAISQWTLSLKTRQSLLTARRKQLKPNLAKNARLRYFVLHIDSLKEFETQVVMFISDYLEKYHFKPAHLKTPVFCLDTSEEQFRMIELRLYQKGIITNDGYVANVFDESRFLRDPMTKKGDNGAVEREFSLRLLRWSTPGTVLNKRKSDDLFVLGAGGYAGLDIEDVNLEELATDSFNEIKYMLGLIDVCE
ncbi:hypothetical protein [Methylotuvimicrobium alcaliphilum]|uniref:Uncharacterized protein n=1 Tax=Methylotuvimicrobium alcaliphilum (strain DSM 19304 / NCIMB 14124 / VKM B-2133 / 20Z) TaxID=1091494 RepID=G4T4L5_META2|nr:hypothetical protein [Methylotuvimicrobium alcaliphilum]CCE25771.1 conserved protein of unknown function [Methylotuvimicrobium alcaliphilum 20Z]